MSVLTSLARLEAGRRGQAQQIATVRHVHLSSRPMVFIPLTLAGEAAAPLAALVGDDRDRPRLLTVPQPRNRDLRFTFAAQLVQELLPYIDSFAATELVEPKRGEPYERAQDAPQLIVPNGPGIGYVRLLGRSTRFRKAEGPYPVHPSVPVLGRWLTFLADRAEYPGSGMLLAATQALAMHWATGQSALEDANLGSLLAWITSGAEAAKAAEDPLQTPPAGPRTDPSFDNVVLEPLIRAYDEGDPYAADKISEALLTQLAPTWKLLWQAIDLLRELPEGASVAGRWEGDRAAYTMFSAGFAVSYPQARRDSAVAAAARLARLERAHEAYEAARALDDPLIMAEHRLNGQAFAGKVVASEAGRIVMSEKNRKLLRPLLAVQTDDPVRLSPGEQVRCGEVGGTIVENARGRITLEISKGMGTINKPAPLPEGWVCFATVANDFQQQPVFPDRESTPWTHGGPPREYVPTDEDAVEEWS